MFLHPPEEDGTRRDAVKVPLAALLELELADRFYHGHDLRILAVVILLFLGCFHLELHCAGSRSLPVAELLLDGRVEIGVGKVNIRHELAQ